MFVVIMIGISFNSCDELIKNKNSENQKSELTNQAINKNKNEAKLLLMLSKDNQDVINLSKALQEVINKDSIIDLAKKNRANTCRVCRGFTRSGYRQININTKLR